MKVLMFFSVHGWTATGVARSVTTRGHMAGAAMGSDGCSEMKKGRIGLYKSLETRLNYSLQLMLLMAGVIIMALMIRSFYDNAINFEIEGTCEIRVLSLNIEVGCYSGSNIINC
jgi:hypothetical protein